MHRSGPGQQRLGLVAASRGRPAPARSSRRRAASSSGSPSCARRRSPRAATWWPRRGSSRSAGGTAPRRVSALRSTRSRATVGSRSEAAHSRHGCLGLRACRCAHRCRARASRLWRTAAQLQHAPPADRVQVDLGAGRVVAALVDDLPLHAGRVQRDRLVGAEHQQPVAERLELDVDLAELGAGGELDAGPDGAGQHPDQRGRSDVGVVPVGAAVQPVGDGQPGPAGLHRHRAGPVALARAACRRPVGRAHREVAGRVAARAGAAKMAEESGLGWHSQVTVASGASSATVRPLASIGVPLDGYRVLAEEPLAPGLQQQRQYPGRRRSARRPGTAPWSHPVRS